MDGSLKQRRSTVITVLFLLGLTIILAIWGLERHFGLIAPPDRYAYPALALLCGATPWLLHRHPRHRTAIELCAYGVIAGYFLAKLTIATLLGREEALYSSASLLQWLPFLYVAAFILFERHVARIAAGAVFLISLLPTLGALAWLPGGLDPALGLLLLNGYSVHFLILAALSLITSLNARYEQAAEFARTMQSAALTDTLTGVANRRGLEELLRSLGQRRGRSVGLVLMDVDHFKSVNDRHGHLVGDDLLVSLAARLRRELRDNQRIGRWGGEEFLVLVMDESPGAVLETAERLRRAARAVPHPVAGAVTMSCGVALWTTGVPAEAALARADAALYAAKEGGRNQVVLAGTSLAAA